MEEYPYAFVGMSVTSSFIAFLVAWAGLRRSAFRFHWVDLTVPHGFYPFLGWQRFKRSGFRHLTAGKALAASLFLCGKSVRKTGHDIFHLIHFATNIDITTRV